MPTQPILQYEFFLVNGPLTDIAVESQNRLDDNLLLILSGEKPGFGIKCTIRAYDHDHMVTQWAQELSELKKERDDLLNSFNKKNLIQKWLLHKRLDQIKVKSHDLEEFIRLYALDYIDRAFNRSVNIALENLDRSFSTIPRDDLHELKEAVSSARMYWLFVFKPNKLLADKNEIMVSLM